MAGKAGEIDIPLLLVMANCQGPVLTLTSSDNNITTLFGANTCFVIIDLLISVIIIVVVATILIVIVTTILIVIVSTIIIVIVTTIIIILT